MMLPWPVALLLAGAAMLPPLRNWLESSMPWHMLVHIPLYVLLGGWLSHRAWQRWPHAMAHLAPLRLALLVLAITTLALWMIPRMLDLAVEHLWVDGLKALSLALFGGAALGTAWRHLGPVARGLLHVEALASLLRLGWLYLESPVRLCSRYGLSDQQTLGRLLLALGAGYALWLAWQGLCGRPGSASAPSACSGQTPSIAPLPTRRPGPDAVN